MMCHGDRNIYLHWGVRWFDYRLCNFPSSKVFCLRGSAICTVGLLVGFHESFKTSNNFTVRWPTMACLWGRFPDLFMLEWSIFCDFRHVTTSSLGFHSHFSHISVPHIILLPFVDGVLCIFMMVTRRQGWSFSNLFQIPFRYHNN